LRAAQIAAALGNARREGHNWRCRCPVHGGCILSLSDGRHGLLVTCWAGCETHEVLAELRRRGLVAGRSNDVRPVLMPICSDDSADAAGRIALARRIWNAARDAGGSPVAHYLTGRGSPYPGRLRCAGRHRCGARMAPAGRRWWLASIASTAS